MMCKSYFNNKQIVCYLIFILLNQFVAFGSNEKENLIKNSKIYLPNNQERNILLNEIEKEIENFDADFDALKVYTSSSANHYHSKRVGMYNHPSRESARFAVTLLESGALEYQPIAFKIIESVIAAQDQNPNSETYGIWPYYLEEPLDKMHKPDWNWADFIGVQMLEAYMKFYDDIPNQLKTKMEASIIHASLSIKKRDVKPGYTNIAIMGTLVTHLAGHLFNNKELKDYADMRMKRFYDHTKKLNGFTEYNSPTYTRVALDELIRMKQYIQDPTTLEMVDFCYFKGWEVLATHFHVPTGQLAGPHSRSYSTLARDKFYDILYGASNGKIKFGNAQKPTDYYKLQHKIPDELIEYFLKIPGERIQIDTFSVNENPPIGYTYLTPQYCFGSVNRSTTWQQRRPFIAYWGNTTAPKFLRVKLLHDDEDFGIGNIFTVQEKGEALTAVNFAVNGGDYHISIDRLKDGKFVAKDVRLRFEMPSTVSPEHIKLSGEGWKLNDENIQISVKMLKAVFGDENINAEVGGDNTYTWVDFIIYNGEKKEFDLQYITEACFAWHTVFNSSALKKASLIEKNNRAEISTKQMTLSVPVKPALENELQDAFVIKKH